MQFNEKVQKALRHVSGIFPSVTQVFFGADGRWFYCDEDFNAPDFDQGKQMVDIELLEDAASAADNEVGFPCAYRLLGLPDYYVQWDRLSDVAVSEGSDAMESDTIAEPFLHFAIGTSREVIWHWFEAQHPDIVVGELMQGIRR